MIFDLFEYYDEDTDEDICFICFESKIKNEIKPINLGNQHFYIKNCLCNCLVHQQCLKKWLDSNKICPICRIRVFENNKISIVFYSYIPYGLYAYDFSKNIIIKSFKAVCILFFWFVITDLYLNVTSICSKNNNRLLNIDDIY